LITGKKRLMPIWIKSIYGRPVTAGLAMAGKPVSYPAAFSINAAHFFDFL